MASRMRPSRRAIAAAILVFWCGVVAFHVRREYFKPLDVLLAEGSLSLAPGAEFYVVRMAGQAIGYASSRLDTLPAGFRFEELMVLDVPAMDTLHRAVVRTRVDLGRALELRSFSFQLESAIGRYEVEGVAVGDSLLDLVVGSGGSAQRSRVRTERGMILPTALPLRLAAGGLLQVGRSYRLRLFDPSTLAGRDVEIRVTHRDTMIVADSVRFDMATRDWVVTRQDTVQVWRVEETFGGVTVATWLDGSGRTVRAESAIGFEVERVPFELARREWEAARGDPRLASGYGAIIESTAIASNIDPATVDTLDRLRVRLVGVELDGFDLVGGRQQLRGDTLIVERERDALRASYRLPYRGGGEAAAELESTPLIQADDPRIIALAREITNGTDDPLSAAWRLNDWVFRELRKEITLSLPSALQVLEARQGDCNEHTVLYVALARAIGLPTRTAVGVVNIRGRFYYHAWPEVWLDRWVAVDPTLGQLPADASHLRFLVGGLARQVELIRLIGRLSLEVV
jgi:transglutaminase-like putative cysteine protease